MWIFTNRDIKRLFVVLSGVFALFIVLLQGYFWLVYGKVDIKLLLFTLLLAAVVAASFYFYFRRQQQTLDNATAQINLFISGDRDTRIESNDEGSLYKLFHAVNILATTLNAHAVREHQAKAFLKNTIGDISHQLKTPLAALTIYNSILQEECEDGAAVREFSLKSEKEIERIEILVQNLLKITRLDAGSIIMDRRNQNVSEIMNDIKAHFETRAAREQKEIIWSGPAELFLLCDRDWLTEAISNVVKNALDHTAAGGQIRVSWNHLPSGMQMTVKDNGRGIHPEDIHHIFKRFYRSRFPRNYSGNYSQDFSGNFSGKVSENYSEDTSQDISQDTSQDISMDTSQAASMDTSQATSKAASLDTQGIGLGLPLTKAIVEAHDGNITVDSVLGSGSTFTMNFLK